MTTEVERLSRWAEDEAGYAHAPVGCRDEMPALPQTPGAWRCAGDVEDIVARMVLLLFGDKVLTEDSDGDAVVLSMTYAAMSTEYDHLFGELFNIWHYARTGDVFYLDAPTAGSIDDFWESLHDEFYEPEDGPDG